MRSCEMEMAHGWWRLKVQPSRSTQQAHPAAWVLPNILQQLVCGLHQAAAGRRRRALLPRSRCRLPCRRRRLPCRRRRLLRKARGGRRGTAAEAQQSHKLLQAARGRV